MTAPTTRLLPAQSHLTASSQLQYVLALVRSSCTAGVGLPARPPLLAPSSSAP